MTVRHIETSKQLTEQLSVICGGLKTGLANEEDLESSTAQRNSSCEGIFSSEEVQDKTDSSSSSAVQHVSSRAAALMAAGAGLRLKVDVRSTMFEDLVVSVTDQNLLTVHTSHDSNKILLRSSLPDTVELNRLLCYVHGPTLLVQERPEEQSITVFIGTDCAYLPVVRENEIKKELTIVLHVPALFQFKDLNVRTIDDSVVITGIKDGGNTPANFNSAIFSFDSSVVEGATQPPSSFQVTMQLPTGTDSRSVSAWLAKHNQIIVKGRLCPTSRSCTM